MKPPSLLSTVRASWTEKDLIPEMSYMHQRTVKRWWKKLRCPPDKSRRPNTWTQAGAEKLLRSWRNWWTQRGHCPDVQVQKFSGALPLIDKKQLTLEFGNYSHGKN
jgi:hypothetical protein